MSATLPIDDLLIPLLAAPEHSAVLLDIDGTLAPIVRHADDAHVPEATRKPLIVISKRYGLVACISGRRATTARRIVSLGSITYVGNHGAELLSGGQTEPQVAPEAAGFRRQIQRFASAALASDDLVGARIRGEDKHAVYAFHWRGAPDEDAAFSVAEDLARRAESEGLGVHWGRMVLEIRPPVLLTKGTGVRTLLERHPAIRTALYIGDDRTDVDAFGALRELAAGGRLERTVCLGVRSSETPSELEDSADQLLDGPPAVRAVLETLASV